MYYTTIRYYGDNAYGIIFTEPHQKRWLEYRHESVDIRQASVLYCRHNADNTIYHRGYPLKPQHLKEVIRMQKGTNLCKVRLEIKVSPVLREKIVKAAAKDCMTISQYCSMVLSNNKSAELLSRIHESNLKIIELYSRIGNNINQLARHCNELGVGASRKQIADIVRLIDQATEEIKERSIKDANSKAN